MAFHSYCVQETCNFDALYAYLTCGNYDFNVSRSHSNPALPFAILAHADAVPVLAQYDRIKNLRPRKNIRTAMNHGAWGLPAVRAHTASRSVHAALSAVRRDQHVRVLPEGAERPRQGGRGVQCVDARHHEHCAFADSCFPLHRRVPHEPLRRHAQRAFKRTSNPAPPISWAHARACVCAQMLIIPPQLSL